MWVAGAGLLPAQIVIDTFFVETSLVSASGGNSSFEDSVVEIDGGNATRRLTASATGSFAMDTESIGTALVVDGGGTVPGTANAELEYLGYSLNLGENFFFEINVDRVVGTPTLGIFLTNTTANITLTTGAELLASTNGYSVFFDVRQLSGYTSAFLNGVDDITVFFGDGDQDFFVEADYIQFSPVPEPSTLAMLGLGVLGWMARRSRRSSVS
jgi:hypothetical protein